MNTFLTILMPCLNEEETIEKCILKAKKWIDSKNIPAEILIADNGSNDKSIDIALKNGARVINVNEKGYGSALYHGCENAKGDFIIFGDSDDSYDFSRLDDFYNELINGCDLVMGNRFKGGIKKGAMPWKNKYIGNPVLSFIGKCLYNKKIGDFHCGLRGIKKEAFKKMDLISTGMEFASEMVIKASMLKMRIAEVPIILHKDGRSKPPHLNPWRDGWRHLKFLLIFSPNTLFIYPGIFIFLFFSFLYFITFFNINLFGEINFGNNSLVFLQLFSSIGFLYLNTGIAIREFGIREKFYMKKKLLLKFINVESMAISSILLILLGVYKLIGSLSIWSDLNFGSINNLEILNVTLKSSSLSGYFISHGFILFIFSLILTYMQIAVRRNSNE